MHSTMLHDAERWPRELRLHAAAMLTTDRFRTADVNPQSEAEHVRLLSRVLDTFPPQDSEVASLRPFAAPVPPADRDAYRKAAQATTCPIARRALPPAPTSFDEYQVRMEALTALPWVGPQARSCPVGWLPLLDRAVRYAEKWVDSRPLASIRTLQIKEKFGTLRWYVRNTEALTRTIVHVAESTSWVTCLVCGQPGEWRPKLPWIQTLCDRHFAVECHDLIPSIVKRAYPRDRTDFDML